MPSKREEPGSQECSVKGCKNETKRSMSAKKVKESMPKLTLEKDTGKRANLCKDHYKEFKKANKEERLAERLSWS